MAEVALDYLYIHDYTNQSDYDTFGYADLEETWTMVGRVRRLAAGRLRLTTATGAQATYDIRFHNLTAAEVQSLRDRAGTHVMVRDMRGRVVYGVYFDVDVVDRPENGKRNASLTLETVTGTVAV